MTTTEGKRVTEVDANQEADGLQGSLPSEPIAEESQPKAEPGPKRLPVRSQAVTLPEPLEDFTVTWSGGLSFETYKQMVSFGDLTEDSGISDVSKVWDDMIQVIGEKVMSWDLVDLQGEPLPAGVEGVRALVNIDMSFLGPLVASLTTWVQTSPKVKTSA